MAKIIVTGGSGFLGYHTIRALKNHAPNSEVVIFDPKRPDWPFEGEVINQDITDAAKMRDHILNIRPEAIIHLAGILGTSEQIHNVLSSLRVNTTATVELLEFLKDELPKTRVALTMNGNGTWNNTYAITKEAAGRFALMFNKEFGTKFAVLRAYNAFGEWQKASPIRKIGPHVFTRALLNEQIEIFGNGEQKFDLIYAGHAGEALARSVVLPLSDYNQVFEVGSGTTVTPVSFTKSVMDVIGNSSSTINFLPMRPGEPDMSVLVANVSTLKQLELGKSDVRASKSDLRRTIDWYRTAIKNNFETYIDRC